MDAVSKYTRIFGRFAITTMNTTIGVAVMYWNNDYQEDLSGLMIPAFVIFVFTYCIATLFMEVFDVAVESIYLCYLVDEKVHGDQPKFASQELQEVVDSLPEQPIKDTHEVGSEAEVQEMGRSTTDIATEV